MPSYHSPKAIILHLHTCAFFLLLPVGSSQPKKTCENYMLFSGLNHFATSFLRLAYLLTHCTVTPISVQKLTEHNILKTLILTQRFKLKTSFWTCFVLVGSFDISLCKKQFKKVSFTQKVSVRWSLQFGQLSSSHPTLSIFGLSRNSVKIWICFKVYKK